MASGGWSSPYLCLCWLGSGNDKVVMVLLPLGSSLWCSYTVWVEGVREVRREPCGWHVLELQQVHSRGVRMGTTKGVGQLQRLPLTILASLLVVVCHALGRVYGEEGRMRWTTGRYGTAHKYPATSIVVLCYVVHISYSPARMASTAAPIVRALRQCSSGKLGRSVL